MPPRIEIYRHCKPRPWTYADLDKRQREVALEVNAGQAGALLFSEVSPVITVGRRTQATDIFVPRETLASQGVEVHPTDRGGFATYHGPGQWVVFPVEKLQVLTGDSRGIRRAVEGLLTAAALVAGRYRAGISVKSGAETGVWTPQGKVAAVGLHIENGIVHHGLALNCFKTVTSFVGLRPCGLDAPVNFLLDQGDEAQFLNIRKELETELLQIFWG